MSASGRIIRRSGGGTQLAYSWVNAASYGALPGSPPTDTIGFITSIPVVNVYPTNENPSGLGEGDVLLRQGNPSSVRINMLKTGRLDLYPSGAYQNQSGVLVPIDSYVYQAGAWKAIFASFYEPGSIPSAIADYLMHRFTGTSSTLTKGAGSITYAQTGTSTRGWAYSRNKINITPLKTIRFYAKVGTGGGTSGRVGVTPEYGVISTSVYTSFNDATFAVRTVDVSTLVGEYHIAFGIPETLLAQSVEVQYIRGN